MKALLGSTERISFCADIWTKPGMTAALLGVIEHFYSRLDRKRHQITVAVQRFPSPHTGENVAKKMYTIITLSSCVFRVITDNGSNMVAAFKETNEEGDKLDDDIVAYTIDDSDDDEAEDTDVEGEDGDNVDDIEDSQSSMSSEKQIAEYERLDIMLLSQDGNKLVVLFICCNLSLNCLKQIHHLKLVWEKPKLW